MAMFKGPVVAVCVSLVVMSNLVDSSPVRSKINRRWVTTSTPKSTTTSVPSTGEALLCHVDGKSYKPGEIIDSYVDMFRNHCGTTYCNQEGRIIRWENWNCFTTPTPFPTTTPLPTTTTPMTTTS